MSLLPVNITRSFASLFTGNEPVELVQLPTEDVLEYSESVAKSDDKRLFFRCAETEFAGEWTRFEVFLGNRSRLDGTDLLDDPLSSPSSDRNRIFY